MVDEPNSMAPAKLSGLASSAIEGGRLRLQTLVLIRWIALLGQALAIVVVKFGLGFDMAFVPALLVVAVSIGLNTVLTLRYAPTTRLSDLQAALYLAYDTLQLAILLYLTGGIENPFSMLMLVPVTVSATVLSLRSTVLLGVLSLACLSIVTINHQALPWHGDGLALPGLYVAGIWIALVLGMGFITVYAWRVAAEARRMSDALGEIQLALAREQQLSSLGGLAAAAAHELGTPLSTITLVAREMRREAEDGTALADDMDLLLRETERCREILAELSRDPRREGGSPFEQLALPALVDSIAAPLRKATSSIEITECIASGLTMPIVRTSPEIRHGLSNVIENATDFAATRVDVTITVSPNIVALVIADDGPGFAHTVLGDLGEPYVSTRRADGGMGLGLFIAKTLLERTGAQVTFHNAVSGGAKVAIRWPRDILSATEMAP
ncbi:MAG: ActS/PrrB/RegB family redox-sensitive histidine kinase [Alphaproteobacteria bacterium]|nr:ActS/PrrB/RegB family redox-sensitive histidine kinase [Alphaproteobacteria bacterium]